MLKKLKDECYVVMGQSPSSTSYNQTGVGFAFMQGRKTFGNKYPKIEMWTSTPTKIGKKDSVLLSVRAPVGDINMAPCDLCIGRGLASIKMKNGHNQYLYYLLKNNVDKVKKKALNTVFEAVNRSDLENLILDFHDETTQIKISKVMSYIDKRIELNNQMNDSLYEIGMNIYQKNYLEAGIKKFRKLSDFFPVVTGKCDANDSVMNGKYPFFTCSHNTLKIDSYSFDASAILLSGNGDFNVKFYRGKFDAYQRTYVLIPYDQKHLGFLYFSIQYNLKDLMANYRGSVINFITKGCIEDYQIPVLQNEKVEDAFNKILTKIEKNNQENEVLFQLREALLPKLMSNEIDLTWI